MPVLQMCGPYLKLDNPVFHNHWGRRLTYLELIY